MSSRRHLLASAPALLLGRAALAQDAWPDRPIRFVAPFAAGGAADITARIAAEALAPLLGQPLTVENRTGGGGIIGTELVARARPDGYTLLNIGQATHAINPALQPMGFDPAVDTVAIAPIGGVPTVLLVPMTLPVRDSREFVALARAKPGELAYGSAGIGSASHMALALLAHGLGLDMPHIPYRGTAVAMPDLLGGRLAAIMDNLPSALPHIRDGRVRALAVSTDRRLATLPEVPTVAETVLPGYATLNWYGIAAPAGTPEPIIARIAAAVATLQGRAEYRARLAAAGLEPLLGTPVEFAAYIAADRRGWTDLIRAANIRPE
jgi:tripartite-type tricarboxylate transporter receptor subunit TctC